MEFLRKYATPLSLVTSLAVSITGLMLLFGVRGQIGEIHEWIGVAFVAAILMHIVRNWKGLGHMFQSTAAKATAGIGAAIAIALIVTAFPAGGQGGHGGQRGGPWIVLNRVADAPISASAPALGLTADEAVTKLRGAGVEVDGPKDSLAHLVRDHGQSLPRLYSVLINR
jgi:hypothetical protein